MATGLPRRYIATAQVFDDEMQAKVDQHLAQRGADWTTIEAPFKAAKALADAKSDQIVLLDCATLWLTNHLLAEHDLAQESDALITALKTCSAKVVVVSNEVGAGIVPDNALSRQFREEQGHLNQRLAAEADLVVTVIAGLPLALKGALPETSQ